MMRGRYGHGSYTVQLPRNGWVTLLTLLAAGAAAAVVLALIVALLAVAATAAVLIGGAWLAWKLTRAAAGPAIAALEGGPVAVSRRPSREVRGLLEMAATADPMEQYLIAVREFERISMAAIALDPEQAGAARTRRRAAELAERAANLDDAVTGVEQRLVHDPHAGGARTHVWELALAVREVEQYLITYGSVRGRASLAALRTLVSRRAALTSRRTALVERLESVRVTRALPGDPAP